MLQPRLQQPPAAARNWRSIISPAPLPWRWRRGPTHIPVAPLTVIMVAVEWTIVECPDDDILQRLQQPLVLGALLSILAQIEWSIALG